MKQVNEQKLQLTMALSVKNDEIYKLEANLVRAHQDFDAAQLDLKRLEEEKAVLRESNADTKRKANTRILQNAKKMEHQFATLKDQVKDLNNQTKLDLQKMDAYMKSCARELQYKVFYHPIV